MIAVFSTIRRLGAFITPQRKVKYITCEDDVRGCIFDMVLIDPDFRYYEFDDIRKAYELLRIRQPELF